MDFREHLNFHGFDFEPLPRILEARRREFFTMLCFRPTCQCPCTGSGGGGPAVEGLDIHRRFVGRAAGVPGGACVGAGMGGADDGP